ncbi:MAG: hypothetical protein ABR928_02410 [Terracidiphilus sp.]
MYALLSKTFAVYTLAAVLIAIRFGYIAATESEGARKCNARLIASLLFSSWFCLASLLWYCYDQSLPVFEFQGAIESVLALDSYSKHYSAYVQIHTTEGGDIRVHYSDWSSWMRAGEKIKVRYRGDTGELINATFYSPDGKQEGVLNSTRTFQQAGMFLVGMFCVWASFKKRHRASEPDNTMESWQAGWSWSRFQDLGKYKSHPSERPFCSLSYPDGLTIDLAIPRSA